MKNMEKVALEKDLAQIVGARNIRIYRIERLCYSRDVSAHEGIPDAVVFAKTTELLSKILKLAYDNDIKVIPRGSGTTTSGAIIACFGRVILDLSRMNNIKEINSEDSYAVVEPEVICQHLNNALAPTHFFPPDPGSATIASIGGMVSSNASGNRSIKYGATKDYILALDVGAEVVVSAFPSCKSNLQVAAARLRKQKKGQLKVMDITELLAESLA